MAYGLPYGMASRDVALCIFIAAFLHVSLGQTLPKSEVLPEFLALLENHTVTQGRDVSFTCVVNHLQSYKTAANTISCERSFEKLNCTATCCQVPRISERQSRTLVVRGVTPNNNKEWFTYGEIIQPSQKIGIYTSLACSTLALSSREKPRATSSFKRQDISLGSS